MKIEVIDASDYVAAIPEGRRPHVEAVRKLVRRVVPDSVERSDGEGIRFSYGGKAFAAVSSEKAGLGLYLLELSARPELVKKYAEVLGGLDMAKDCIRFQELDELPIDVIADILRETLASGAKATKKAAKPAKKAAAAAAQKKPKKAVKTAAKKPAAKKAAKPAKRAAKAPSKKAAKKPASSKKAKKAKKAKKKSRR